jgi:hypothetical protein
VAYSAGSERAIAGSLVVATVSGLAVGVTAPSQLRLLSYGLFGGASIVFMVTLIVTGVAITTPGFGTSDDGGQPRSDVPPSPPTVQQLADRLSAVRGSGPGIPGQCGPCRS